jgi:TerB N-terminal domain/TerB-C domain
MYDWLKRITGGLKSPPVPRSEATRQADELHREPSAVAEAANRQPTITHSTGNPQPSSPLYSPGARGRIPACRVTIGPRHLAEDRVVRARPGRKEEVRWVPPGGLVTIHGFDILGMIYIGAFMSASPGGGWNVDTPAPCLINPALRVDQGRSAPRTEMGYWPSYSDITPDHRRVYLSWLSSGKKDAAINIGYVFLYFYGLERRLLVDNPAPEEEMALVAELHRLRDIYAGNNSFDGYNRGLLDVVELRRISATPGGFAAWKPDLASRVRGYDLPLPLKIKLALHAVSGVPLDWEHAVAAMLALPPFMGGLPEVVALTRTREEFISLVRQRFERRFPKGFLLQDRKDSILMLPYRAASQHLEVEVRVQGFERLPDPANLTWTKMSPLCETALNDLTAYAKLLRKRPGAANSLAGALCLPPELAGAGPAAAIMGWLESLPAPVAGVPTGTLALKCLGESRETLNPKQAAEVSALLARAGFGFEPDPSLGGGKIGATTILFRLGQAATEPLSLPPSFRPAALAVAALSSADSGPDPAYVVTELANRQGLDRHAALRLAARYCFARGTPATPARLRKMAVKMPEGDRQAAVALATAVASACGALSDETVAVLERLHDACQVERRKLYSALHHGAAAATVGTTEPVVVERPAPGGRAFRIPPPPPERTKDRLAIDMERVGRILRETREVEEVLAPIYAADEPQALPPGSPAAPRPAAERPLAATRFPGLGADHARLLETLCSQESWPRAEFDAKAREVGLMADGAIETINEWAYGALGDALVEDGDPLIIDLALLPGDQEEAA